MSSRHGGGGPASSLHGCCSCVRCLPPFVVQCSVLGLAAKQGVLWREKCWKVITSPCLAAQNLTQTEPQTGCTQQKMVEACHGLSLSQHLQRLNLAALAVPAALARPRGLRLCGSGLRRPRDRPLFGRCDSCTATPMHMQVHCTRRRPWKPHT